MQLEDKFLVLKRTDIEAGLDPTEKDMLFWLAEKVAIYRVKQGKPENKYVVVNQDEPYYPDVFTLMEWYENRKETLKKGT